MKKALFIICVLNCFISKAQKLYIESSVDTLDADVNAAIHFYQDYLYEFKSRTTLPDFSQYWTKEDVALLKRPDQMLYALTSDGVTYNIARQRTVYYVNKTPDYIHIKTLFATVDSSDHVNIMSLANHYINYSGERLYFIDPVATHMKEHHWQTTGKRNITYHYPAYHHFDEKKANTMMDKVTRLEMDWKQEPISITYYFANTREELRKLRGFDYITGDGNGNNASGISDDVDNIVYCSGWGEAYFHEVVHIYLNRLYPDSPLKEGLAVFYGGSLGHDLLWHVKRVNKYMAEHPEIDLNDFDNVYYMDAFTNPYSTLLGFLCYMAFEKEDIDGLKKIMQYNSLDDIFSKYFKIKKGDRNRFLRDKISLILKTTHNEHQKNQ